MLRQIYGEIILQKDSILYHTSDEPYTYKSENERPFLFCSFHPSEYGIIGEYVTKIKLKKDTSLFFMIDTIKKAKIYLSRYLLLKFKINIFKFYKKLKIYIFNYI